MKINEVESRTGMTRANIRYYEKEGLLAPARGENGYRDYSEEDISALEKVKLLRQLGLTVDTIRAVQKGEVTLDAALAHRQEELSREAEEAALARDLCAAIRGDHAGYADLEPARYRARVSEAAAAVPARTDVPAVHPWRRFFARTLDLALYSLVWDVLAVKVLVMNPQLHETGYRLLTLLTQVVLMFLLEPVLIHRWGTTPGKWLLGISVLGTDGERLRYDDALKRTALLFRDGMGLCIPIYDIWRHYKSYKAYTGGEELPWDGIDCAVSFREDRPGLRGVGTAGLYLGTIALVTVMTMRAGLPPNRGPITPEEYLENIAYEQKWQGWMDIYTMGEDGAWTMEGGHTIYEIMDGLRSSGIEPAGHTLTVVDGVVKAVTIVEEGDDEYYAVQVTNRLLAYLALGGTVADVTELRSGAAVDYLNRGAVNGDYHGSGVSIAQSMTARGYRNGSSFGTVLIPEDNASALHFRLEFTVSLDN